MRTIFSPLKTPHDLPGPLAPDVLHKSHWVKLVEALSQIKLKLIDDKEEGDFLAKVWNMIEYMPIIQFWPTLDTEHPKAYALFVAMTKQWMMKTYVNTFVVAEGPKTVPTVLKRLNSIITRQNATPDPKVAAILAMTSGGGIGLNNTMPWRIKGDLKRFKELTLGNVVVMGYNTYMSLGKPLAGRINIVITSRGKSADELSWPEEVHVVDSVEAALALGKSFNTEWVYIVGGGKLYDETFAYCSKIELTQVAGEYHCDTFVKHSRLADKDWHFTVLGSVNHDNGDLSHVYYQLTRG
jgi:dihydrofolate reductase